MKTLYGISITNKEFDDGWVINYSFNKKKLKKITKELNKLVPDYRHKVIKINSKGSDEPKPSSK